jgi:hypothetical protein
MPIDRGFEYRFSEHEFRTVRESVGSLSKLIPINKTLASANTAEDLINLESNTPPALNLITNPSMEVGTPPTGWTASGSTMTRQTTTPRTGTYSMRCVAANAAAYEGAYYSMTNLPRGWYACSAYVRRSGGGTVIGRATSDGGTTFSDSPAITMGNNWAGRVSVVHQVTTDNATLSFYVVTDSTQDITFLVDDAQVEPSWAYVMGMAGGTNDPNPPTAQVTTFVDPLIERFSRWMGTADASVSVREPSMSEIHDIYLYSLTNDAVIDFNRTATNTGDAVGLVLKAGVANAINLRHIVKHSISFRNNTNGETCNVIGYVRGI